MSASTDQHENNTPNDASGPNAKVETVESAESIENVNEPTADERIDSAQRRKARRGSG